MASPRGNPDRAAIEHRIAQACDEAESLIARLGYRAAPIDPVSIAQTEHPLLRLCPGNYKDAFDGRLEYLSDQKRFLCYYNTKYDRAGGDGHAPRTRFSLAHELGHFFIESHHEYLRSGGHAHPSQSEFRISAPVEQQADSFAARLLMPDRLVKPLVNQDELSIAMISELADIFRTSFVSTAIRAVECTHYYCAIAAICDGDITWTRRGDPLIQRGVYPGAKGPVRSASGLRAWEEFVRGALEIPERSGWTRDWFQIYDDDLRNRLPVTEAYLPAPIMDTLLVVLTIPQDELWDGEDD